MHKESEVHSSRATYEDVPEEYNLLIAGTTDEIHGLAWNLAAWALRQGMHPETVVDWVLDQPREQKLERGSHGLNPTEHHVRKGAQIAVDTFDPAATRPDYDPGPVEALRKRIKLAELKQEAYLLGVCNLCDRYETHTPVITGKNLAEASGKGKAGSDKVVHKWSQNMAYGLFTKVTYDGVHRHGRVWTVNVEWEPVERLTHAPGCRRGTRCTCEKSAQNSLPIFTAEKIGVQKCAPKDKFEPWLRSLPEGSPVTVKTCCEATGFTRYMAGKWLEAAEGTELLREGTYAGGWRVKGGKRYRQGKTWFTPKPSSEWEHYHPSGIPFTPPA